MIINTAFSSFLNISIPFDTVFIASTSSPESVSSSIASFGFSTSICNISFFFFSPPEKPTFRLLSMFLGFIFKSSIYFFSSSLNSNIFTGFPVTLFFAYFKKFVTEIPGISSGNWNDINIPFLAISSVFEFVISSPSNSIFPFTFLYSGLFNIAFAVVVFPDPFGPIIT